MARGLSELQKQILILAYTRRQKAEAEDTYMSTGYGCDLYATHVLEGYYGWKKSHNYKVVIRGGHNFKRDLIGMKEYNSARVAVSKAFVRLQDRGLVIPSRGNEYTSWSGINLTEEGIRTAKELLANSKLHDIIVLADKKEPI